MKNKIYEGKSVTRLTFSLLRFRCMYLDGNISEVDNSEQFQNNIQIGNCANAKMKCEFCSTIKWFIFLVLAG